jgi:hypothetical protein
MGLPSTKSRLRRRLGWLAAAIVLGSSALIVAVWFQPQKLWIEDRVRDPEAAQIVTSGDPVEVRRGEFVSREHHTEGTVRILRLPDGRQVARLEGLDTSNGPDLYVYLSASSARGSAEGFDDDYVNLGRLKGNLGDQNYDVPAGTDLDRFATLVIWCDRFNAVFGAADLAPA